MAPTVAQKLKERCHKTRTTTGTADVAARGRMHCVKTKDSQAGASRQKTTDFVRRRRARAVSPSDDKTSNTTGNGISATRRSGRAIGRLGRQDAGHGTTRSTARTDWVGNGCQGTFPFPQLERQDRGRLGQDEHGAGHLRIKVHDLSGTAWVRCLKTCTTTGMADVAARGRMHCVETKGSQGSVRSAQDQDPPPTGTAEPVHQDNRPRTLSADEGESIRARAARPSDDKTSNTAGKGISATRRSVRTERRLRRQDAGRRTIRSTARTDGVGHISSSRLEQEDGGRLGQDEHGAGHLRVRTPGSTSVTSQRRLGWADVMRTVSADEYRCMRVQSDQLTFRPFLSSKDRQAQGPDGLRARATRNSDGKTIITVGKSSSATRQVRAAKGTVRRSKRGTTQCTARTVGVGKSRQDTFPPRAAGAARRRTTRSRRARSRSSKGPDARINVRDLSETAWALRCDKALVRPGGRVDDRCMARAARRCARIKVRDLSETAWKTVRWLKTRTRTGTTDTDVGARGRMCGVETKDDQAGASRLHYTDRVRRRARAARNGRQDEQHGREQDFGDNGGSVRTTAGRLGRFGYGQNGRCRQEASRRISSSAAAAGRTTTRSRRAGHLRINVRDLSQSAMPGRHSRIC
ncbi:hypothetical protein A4X13_0g3668 [Tilletia indica]|uniref:Uncharacterized protein n=1 Tax=Tilletia indica TaxID=43049 RepID=A0A8T8T3S2_9BASI|nr:hypothetical protein A4X13_0g3668 [Tilletia indica]